MLDAHFLLQLLGGPIGGKKLQRFSQLVAADRQRRPLCLLMSGSESLIRDLVYWEECEALADGLELR